MKRIFSLIICFSLVICGVLFFAPSSRAEVIYSGSLQHVYPMSKPANYFAVSLGGVADNGYREYVNRLFIFDNLSGSAIDVYYEYEYVSATEYTIHLDFTVSDGNMHVYMYDGTMALVSTDSTYSVSLPVTLFDGYTHWDLYDFSSTDAYFSLEFTPAGTFSPVWAGEYTYLDLLQQIESNQSGFISWWRAAWSSFRGWANDTHTSLMGRLAVIRDNISNGFKSVGDWFSTSWSKMTSGFDSVVGKLDELINATGDAADKVKNDAADLSQAGSDLSADIGSIGSFEDQQFGVLDNNFGEISSGGDLTNLFTPMSWILTFSNHVVEAVPSNYRSYWTVPFFFGIFFLICQHAGGASSTAHVVDYYSKPKRSIGFRYDE